MAIELVVLVVASWVLVVLVVLVVEGAEAGMVCYPRQP